MSKISEMFGITPRNGFLLGCEFELESINDVSWHNGAACYFANVTEDNSLRNNGKEFVTKPITAEAAIKAHAALFNGQNVYYDDIDSACSDRCSTHIHVNFSDQTEEKTRQFIRLYALVEPLFFKAVDESRQNNIYCVPLSSTHLLKYVFSQGLYSCVEKWHKYAAFNVKRLSDLGTIEFRHFQATRDTGQFAEWVRMIKALYDFNQTNDVDILINDVMMYRLVSQVAGKVYTRDEIYQLCEDTLINDTLITLNPTKDLLNQRLKATKETV